MDFQVYAHIIIKISSDSITAAKKAVDSKKPKLTALEYRRNYYLKNHEKMLNYAKNYYKENKQQCNAVTKAWRARATSKIGGRDLREYNKEYYARNKEKIQLRNRERFEKNKETIKEKQRLYFEKNRELINQKARQKYHKNAEFSHKYRLENKERLKAIKQKYYAKPENMAREIERRRKKIVCNLCGREVNKMDLNRHQNKTKICEKNRNKIQLNLIIDVKQ